MNSSTFISSLVLHRRLEKVIYLSLYSRACTPTATCSWADLTVIECGFDVDLHRRILSTFSSHWSHYIPPLHACEDLAPDTLCHARRISQACVTKRLETPELLHRAKDHERPRLSTRKSIQRSSVCPGTGTPRGLTAQKRPERASFASTTKEGDHCLQEQRRMSWEKWTLRLYNTPVIRKRPQNAPHAAL